MCECGHPDTDHKLGVGRCAGDCYDPEYGVFKCMCPQPTLEGISSESNE
jgi:hypothetical protein